MGTELLHLGKAGGLHTQSISKAEICNLSARVSTNPLCLPISQPGHSMAAREGQGIILLCLAASPPCKDSVQGIAHSPSLIHCQGMSLFQLTPYCIIATPLISQELILIYRG